MFGFDPTNFSDPFDVNKVAETNNRERAKLLSQSFLTDSDLGGKAIGIFGKNKAEDIEAKAQASTARTASNAAGVSGLIDFAGGMGRIGASEGGFGEFFNMGGSGDGGGTTGLALPGSQEYDFFKMKDVPSFIGDDLASSINYDFTSPWTIR